MRLIVDNEFLPQAIDLVKSAQRSIDLASFKLEWTTKPRGKVLLDFWKIIVELARQKITARVLLNWNDDKRSVAKTNLYCMRELKGWGVDVRFLRNNRCCHAKIILVDKREAIIGSHNFSVRSCHNNFEVSLRTQERVIIQPLIDVFERSFYDAQKY